MVGLKQQQEREQRLSALQMEGIPLTSSPNEENDERILRKRHQRIPTDPENHVA